jgi:hypothetical protein
MQDDLRELFSQYEPSLPAGGKKAHVVELCRLVTLNSQVRDEVIYPWCAAHTPTELLWDSMIRMDLARVLVMELVYARPTDLWYDQLVRVLGDDLEVLWDKEESDAGLWKRTSDAHGLEGVNDRLTDRLTELDLVTRQNEWRPLEPAGLETLRNSVPPCATRYADLSFQPSDAGDNLAGV